jgi:hypothetical protein
LGRAKRGCLVKSLRIHWARPAGELWWLGWAWRAFRYVNLHQEPGSLLS